MLGRQSVCSKETATAGIKSPLKYPMLNGFSTMPAALHRGNTKAPGGALIGHQTREFDAEPDSDADPEWSCLRQRQTRC